MSAADSIEGAWGLHENHSKTVRIYHFFCEGDEKSLCGSHMERRECAGDFEVRRPGGRDDCLKCERIYLELFRNRPPEPAVPLWTVKTDDLGDGGHVLFYQGKEHSRARGAGGLATQKDLAALFNKNGTLPKKIQKARCAADAPDPAKFLSKKSKQSPELPLETPPPKTSTPIASPPMKPKQAFQSTAVPSVALAAELRPASEFRRYPSNRTITPEQIAKMSESIRDVGVIQPITARDAVDPETQEHFFEIVIGESRWLGCTAIDPEYLVPVYIRDLSDKEAAKIHAVENFQRKDLDAIEEARAIKHLKDTGWVFEEIEKFLGCKKDWIYMRLTLLKLGDEAHAALREGNITLRTAEMLASIPEEQHGEALKAVCTPVHSTSPLPQRDAMRLLERDFIEPAKVAKDWEEKRDAVLENHPGARWLPYAEAVALRAWNSGYRKAENKPDHELLCDAAHAEELLVPTWGDLAKKHGAQIVIGCTWEGEASTYVKTAPLIEAEKASFADNPGDCIFVHEGAIQQAREESERRKMEKEAHRVALAAESKRLVNVILSPGGLTKTASAKLVEMCFAECFDSYTDLDAFGLLFDIPEDSENFNEKAEAAILKYLRSKSFTPFEAMARLKLADYLSEPTNAFVVIFETKAVKPADFPNHHAEAMERLARLAATEKAEAERAAAAQIKDPATEEAAA